ncbi:MAG: alpha-galactosidase, partial [Clostridia bacterium]
FGFSDMREGAFTVRAASGSRTSDLRFVSATAQEGKPALGGLPATFASDAKTLRLVLRDVVSGLRVTLCYTIFEDVDAIARSVLFENEGASDLHIERAMSLCLDLTDADYELITLSGAWSREREVIRRPLAPGETSVSSVRGASSLQASPFVALARPDATECAGEVIGAALVYSGNFYAGVHVDQHRMARLMLGLHDHDFEWALAPRETFQTPEALLTYSAEGFNGMSAQFHRLCAEHLVRGKYAHAPRPILINNWEATYFNFDEEKLLTIAKTAAKVGVELFVLDDGWFGRRNDDTTSLGDWQVDERKLPHGLGSLAEQIHGLGLKLGLWFEPEMISVQSKLYRAHPDWCIHAEGYERVEYRQQLVLDLSRAEVCEHVYRSVRDILAASPIDYVKWDMNRNFTDIGSAALPPERQKELAHRYMLGLYGVLERLTTEFPDVLFESCASGGGRFDLGMLYYMPQTWCSDNTDAVSRGRIQYGSSMVFPPFSMGAHVSAVPNHQTGRITPLATRASVAMSGCFGYELDLNALSAEEIQEVARQIERVKKLRQTLLYGRFYRLRSPFEGDETAWITVAPDQREAVLLFMRAMARANTMPELVRLYGLNADMRYRVEETGESYGGDQLMRQGLCFALPTGDAASVSLTLRALE